MNFIPYTGEPLPGCDLIRGEKWLHHYQVKSTAPECAVHLQTLQMTPYPAWGRLRRLLPAENFDEVIAALTYADLYSNNAYHVFIPTLWVPAKPFKCVPGIAPSRCDMAMDYEWYLKMFHGQNGMTAVERALLGHGYTDPAFCSPDDGSPGLKNFSLRTDAGDRIDGFGWVWYNK